MDKILITSGDKYKLKERILQNPKEKLVFAFLNSHDVYQFRKNHLFREALQKVEKNSVNLPDGTFISLMKGVKKLRGPELTRFFIKDKDLSKGKRHFFLGFEKEDLDFVAKKFTNLQRNKLYSYNPPYIKGFQFPKKELSTIKEKINNSGADYLWIGLAAPKQNLLAAEIYSKIKAEKIFNVGAALDFIAEKKKEAPNIWRNLGIEWLYRLITDFKYSKWKVWRSFVGTIQIPFMVKKVEFF